VPASTGLGDEEEPDTAGIGDRFAARRLAAESRQRDGDNTGESDDDRKDTLKTRGTSNPQCSHARHDDGQPSVDHASDAAGDRLFGKRKQPKWEGHPHQSE
jgi:hypothetical protein